MNIKSLMCSQLPCHWCGTPTSLLLHLVLLPSQAQPWTPPDRLTWELALACEFDPPCILACILPSILTWILCCAPTYIPPCVLAWWFPPMNVPTYMFTLEDVWASAKFMCEVNTMELCGNGALTWWNFPMMECCCNHHLSPEQWNCASLST